MKRAKKIIPPSLTESQFSALEAARRIQVPFTKEWKTNPLDAQKKGSFPVLNIEYSFGVPEDELAQRLREFRRPYGIKEAPSREAIDRNNKPYYQAVSRRNDWLCFQYRLAKNIGTIIPPELKGNNKIYAYIKRDLKDEEIKNPFCFPFKKSSNYDLSEATIKRIINLHKSN